MGYVPSHINNQTFDSIVDDLKACLATKGTLYYNKIVGGVKCSNMELVKLELVIYLLERRDNASSLDCIFSGAAMPGISYSETPVPTGTQTYIQTFVNHFSKFCKDCITSNPTATPIPGESGDFLLLEDLTPILLENSQKINLE